MAVVEAVLDRRKPSGDLAGRRVLVTAGGTAEPIDPVRFIGNRSSGLMGAEVARAALERGASVTLVVGQTSVPLPPDVLVVSAPTTSAMRTAVLDPPRHGRARDDGRRGRLPSPQAGGEQADP